jgi:hypothetical protein
MNVIAAVIEALVFPVCGAGPFANEERAKKLRPRQLTAHMVRKSFLWIGVEARA